MHRYRFALLMLLWCGCGVALLPARAGAAIYLLDDTLRVKGSVYEFGMYRTRVPGDEKSYRNTSWGLLRTKGTLELLYQAVEHGDTTLNLFGFFQYWRETVPDFDGEYRRSIDRRHRIHYQNPSYDSDDWINELYVDWYQGPLNIRCGKQIVMWSEVEMVRTIDRVNPLDLRYTTPGIDPWDEMKLGLWMLRGIYNTNLPGLLSFEGIWIPGDFEPTRTPIEATSMGSVPSPQGPASLRPRAYGQNAATETLFRRARPAWTLRNSSWALRVRGNSQLRVLGTPYLVDWTFSWYHGLNNTPVARSRTLGRAAALNLDASTLNGYLNRLAVTRVFGLSLPDQPDSRFFTYKFFDALGGSFQTYVPALQGVVRGEMSYEIGVPRNKANPKHIDDSPSFAKPITGTTERDQINIGITLDRSVRVPWLQENFNARGIFDCTLGWFGQWRLGNVTRIRTTFGYYDRSQSNFTLTIRTSLRHNELWPTIRFLYNTRNWGYGVWALRYTPDSHWRCELGYLWFFARDEWDASEAYARNKDSIYFRVGYEF